MDEPKIHRVCICGHVREEHVVEIAVMPSDTVKAVYRRGECTHGGCEVFSEAEDAPTSSPNEGLAHLMKVLDEVLTESDIPVRTQTLLHMATRIIESTALSGGSMKHIWKPGERVELVRGGHSGNPVELRAGTVVEVQDYLLRHESLVVHFDDGETRAINPDVMRHRKES